MAEAPPPTSEEQAPPAWYPDPWQVGIWRWWDGSRWTGHTTGRPPEERRSRPPAHQGEQARGIAAGWIAAGGIVAGFVLSGLVGYLWGAAGGSSSSAVLLALGEVALWVGLGGSCVVASRRKGTGSLSADLGLWTAGPIDLGIGAAAAIAGMVLVAIVSAAVRAIGPQYLGSNTDAFSGYSGAGALTLVALVVCVGAPIVEELFFRGLLQGTLQSRFGAGMAVPGQALMFGLAHADPSQGTRTVSVIVAVGAFGVVLGFVRHRTGRLGPTIVAHALFNLVALAGILAGS